MAKKIGKPAFTVFSNKTLEESVRVKPKTNKELLKIYGISQKKCEAYSISILPFIVNFKVNSEPKLTQKYTFPKLNNQELKPCDALKKLRLQIANDVSFPFFRANQK